MTRVAWDLPGTRMYQNGVDRGVLYVPGIPGVSWNGLISVAETTDGGEATPYYFDGVKFRNEAAASEFKATIKAYTYPSEFGPCDGYVESSEGMLVADQPRQTFGLCYRTNVGNDNTSDRGYKLHLIYNCLAAPSNPTYATIASSATAIDFSWDISTQAMPLSGSKPTAHVVLDSLTINPNALILIEDHLYGSELIASQLLTPQQLTDILEGIYDGGFPGSIPDLFIDGEFPWSVPDTFIDGGNP